MTYEAEGSQNGEQMDFGEGLIQEAAPACNEENRIAEEPKSLATLNKLLDVESIDDRDHDHEETCMNSEHSFYELREKVQSQLEPADQNDLL